MAESHPLLSAKTPRTLALSCDTSKSLMIVWMVLFAAPVTTLLVIDLLATADAWLRGEAGSPLWVILGSLASAAALAGLWALAVSFAIAGPAGLARRSRIWWGCAALGPLVLVAASFAHARYDSLYPVLFFLGWPLVLPLVQLVLERRLRSPAARSGPQANSGAM